MSYFSPLVFEHFKNFEKPYLIICNQQKDAEQLKDDLTFLNPKDITIHVFPDWETLAYDPFSPHQDIISERLQRLYDLIHQKPMILIVGLHTFIHRLPPKTFLLKHVFNIHTSQKFSLNQFKENLSLAQYQAVLTVHEHGEFCCKGSIIDVFPMGANQPVRIEWFDDEIESIRWFDVETQLSREKIDVLQLLPAKEFSLDEESVRLFRQRYREQFPGNPNTSTIYNHVSNHQMIQGLEYFLPLFFEKTENLFDYIPKNTNILYTADAHEQHLKLFKEITLRYDQRKHDVTRPILEPQQLFMTPDELEIQIQQYPQEILHSIQNLVLPDIQFERKEPKPFKKLKDFLASKKEIKVLILASSLGRREIIYDLCKNNDIFPEIFTNLEDFTKSSHSLGIMHGPIAEAYFFKSLQILCITEHELFGETIVYQKQRRKKNLQSPEKYIKDLSELSCGTPVVHVDYGVGRYEGLQNFEFDGIKNEFLIIRYAGDDKIYVPVTRLNLIAKYSASHADDAPMHKLGSEAWQKEKKKASEKAYDMAVELLETQAFRTAQQGFCYQMDWPEYERFTSAFRFVETDDQKNAINAIIKDLQAPQPMDRLICGDVGFGKTEVAMRAAFIVVQNHRQVCILVPTTLLAKQHFETFQERFADFPICVELISRFRTKKESLSVLERLKNGQVDILIGTHKLLQQDVTFKDLGLFIIDEEHRFGVKQKEHLKKIKHQADILSLTATPIPRTLNMAMHGMRDISIISTPPAKRLAIKTFWNEKHPQLLREAILREIFRGGQVYYLHNDIQSIEHLTQSLKDLIPEANIEYAHGQMHERRLEQITADFYHQRFNVLVCTTIIETGIDIPSANTIIIERADQLGLAQLHQLRGRVGRSHHQAYAYLLTPPEKMLSKDAKKRLEAIVSLEDLGAGFTLAMHDMEIRGAGEFLGEQQSGNLHAVGYSMYMEMLEQAVEDIKAGRIPQIDQLKKNDCEIDIKISSIIPEDYMQDIHQRLVFYKRIASTKTEPDLHHLQVELIDRFGLLPEPLKNLINITYLKLKALPLGVKRIFYHQGQGVIEFNEQTPVEPIKIILLIQQKPTIFKLKNPNTLQFTLQKDLPEYQQVLGIRDILANLI